MNRTDRGIFEVVSELEADGKTAALAMIVETRGSSAGKPGMKMIVTEDDELFGTVGGGAIESKVIEMARQVVRDGNPLCREFELKKDLGMTCGGWMRVYIEPIGLGPRAVIFGAGHIGRALLPVLKSAGFRVTVVDDRDDHATADNLPLADRIEVRSPHDGLDNLGIAAGTYLVFATRTHDMDLQWLNELGEREAKYVGLIGSRSKIKLIKERLSEAGISKAAINRLRAPIGIDLGGISPGEIAVSIAAEMIATRYGVARTLPMSRLE
jgi:xanthine dehydrogenase accessory factor